MKIGYRLPTRARLIKHNLIHAVIMGLDKDEFCPDPFFKKSVIVYTLSKSVKNPKYFVAKYAYVQYWRRNTQCPEKYCTQYCQNNGKVFWGDMANAIFPQAKGNFTDY